MKKVYQTVYTTLANRCPNCGHRLDMATAGNRCKVVNGDGRRLENDLHCLCKDHRRI